MAKLKFSMVFHNHQPCDNFGWVLEDAYKKAYEPFIDMLEKYPNVKIGLHYSGSLMAWLKANKPYFIDRLKRLSDSGRVEFMTGGFYEPIFPIIPDNDKSGQIAMLNSSLKEDFDVTPKGIWITERVWENRLSEIFSKEGLGFSILDENHLKFLHAEGRDMKSVYRLPNGFKVLIANEKLRYMIPFSKPRDLAQYFKDYFADNAEKVLVFADDGEKLGFWPHTHDWVYKGKWLESVLDFLNDKNSFVETVTPSEAVSLSQARDINMIPSSSYREMNEWSKGDFNNFFKIYPEANLMRNRMLYVSHMISELGTKLTMAEDIIKALDLAREELYKAQTGCAYWHGVFGGFYLNHLRQGVYRHLINAQNILEKLSKSDELSVKSCDMDGDSNEELILGNKFFDLYLKPEDGGTIYELDNKIKPRNIANAISRRLEPYHAKLFGIDRPKEGFNIYDVLGIKDMTLRRFLVYDEKEKNSLMNYFLLNKASIGDFAKAIYKNMIGLSGNPFRITNAGTKDRISLILEKEEELKFDKKVFRLYIKKSIMMLGGPEFKVEYVIRNLSEQSLKTSFATEFNWSLMDKRYMKKAEVNGVKKVYIKDEWTDVALELLFDDKVKMWSVPVYTLNESESGLERTYQYLSLLVQRPVALKKGQEIRFSEGIVVK